MGKPVHASIEFRGKRFKWRLRGRRASLVLLAPLLLLACIPAAIAFIAYAEGGTSLWAAIAFAVVVTGCAGLYVFGDSLPLRRGRRRD